jgi:hypothetical protein
MNSHSTKPKVAFHMEPIRVPLENLLPTRRIKDESSITRYGAILSSIKQDGMIEPIMIYPQKGKSDFYLILDGHLRHLALKELGHTEADCLISTDDEAFTYNARISRIAPIQEHKMIMKAVKNGVSPERIATALNMHLRDVKALMNLLNGIHHEAAEMLKDKPIAPHAIWAMRKVTAARQIEMAELMCSASNYSRSYADCLVLGTPKNELVNPDEPKMKKGLTAEEIARMEAEMKTVEHDFRAVEQSYGDNNLNLAVARTYVRKLLENAKVLKFLSTRHPELLPELQTIAALEAI